MISTFLPLTDAQADALNDAIYLALLHCADEYTEKYTELRAKLAHARAAGFAGKQNVATGGLG